MSTESIRVSGLIPATPKTVYDAWLDSGAHSKFSGGKATIDPKVGGKHTAWDGYIEGKLLELEPYKRIAMTWRSTDFPSDAPDSRLEVVIESRPSIGCEITFLHSNLPEGQGHQYEMGWLDHYLTPMRRYFTNLQAAKAKALAKAAELKAQGKPAKPVVKAAPVKKAARPAAAKRPPAKKSVAAHKASPKKAVPNRARAKTAKKPGAKKAKSR